MREKNPELHRQRVSASLAGKFGEQSRRWKGDNASYVAKHMWILKHFGEASICEFNPSHRAKRYEWANKNHGESRNRNDYIQLCPSCHRLFDLQNRCRRGHEFTPENTFVNANGFRECIICRNATDLRRKLSAVN